jgi:hypothetical protein
MANANTNIEISCNSPYLFRVQYVHIVLSFTAFPADESRTEQLANNNVYILCKIGMYLSYTLFWLRSIVFILLFSHENGNSIFIFMNTFPIFILPLRSDFNWQ